MPVWHERTRTLRREGKVKVIGITQEQHADRCLLFARWKGIDFPILWDPFNMTGTQAVPRVTLIDEHGIVRATRASIATFEEDFVGKAFPKPAQAAPRAPRGKAGTLVEVAEAKEGSEAYRYFDALSAFLWPAGRDGERAKTDILAYAEAHPKDAAAQWRLGVVYRMRHESFERSLGDFQQAVNHWQAGLELDPSHYIYRRRLEQYGPLLTKPYPFYPWIPEARKALGKDAPTLVAEPTGTEMAGRAVLDPDAAGRPEPDSKGADRSIQDGLRIEATVVYMATRKGRLAARVHLHLIPAGNRVLLWDAQAPVYVHVEPLESSFTFDSNTQVARLRGTDPAEEIATLDFEAQFEPGKAEDIEFDGYILYRARTEPRGPSRLIRQDFRRLTLPRPGK